ncbi:fluoride efflux transporter CrcB [Virgibacillus siamensis]|uniref:fluoride efflux transporter CrcB n=1 Tax=Virgibacillus siamensis TaxID=480071 RepID=UPI0009871C8F|nr:fluoride efflux transporter CrcB [Virgibacillus siamensis]
MSFLYVAIGGFFGSMARFSFAKLTGKHPIGTWIVNITGSVLLALLVRFHVSEAISEWLWLSAGAGFCGSFTTFSTFGNETLNLLLEHRYFTALLYIICSLAVSFTAVILIL